MLVQAQIYSLSKGKLTNVNEQENIGTTPDKITDVNRHEIKLKSTGAMINYFDKNGWLLINAYSFGNANQAAMRYIFKRKIK